MTFFSSLLWWTLGCTQLLLQWYFPLTATFLSAAAQPLEFERRLGGMLGEGSEERCSALRPVIRLYSNLSPPSRPPPPPTPTSPKPGIRQLDLRKCVRASAHAFKRRGPAENRCRKWVSNGHILCSFMGYLLISFLRLLWWLIIHTSPPPQCSPLRWKRPSKTLRPSFRFQTVLGGGGGLKGRRLMSGQRAVARRR